MGEWLRNIPVLGRLFRSDDLLEEEPMFDEPETGNAQLNAALKFTEQLESQLEECREQARDTGKKLEQCRREYTQLHERTAGLDDVLGDPERAYSVIVYYQLQALWSGFRTEIKAIVDRLSEHMAREEKEQLLGRFRQQQEERISELEKDRRQVESELSELWEKRKQLERTRRQLNRFWHYFRRKEVEKELEAVDVAREPVEKQLEDVREKIAEVQDRDPPRYSGLSVDARRQINLAAIALAQYFYLQMREQDILEMLLGARKKHVTKVFYGRAEECVKITNQVASVSQRWQHDQQRHEKVRRRAAYLGRKVRYASDQATIPERRSLSAIDPVISDKGEASLEGGHEPLPVNVLEMDLWDLSEALLGEPTSAPSRPE